MAEGRVFVRRGSQAADLAGCFAWLWRLGPPLDEPHREAVGFGALAEAAELNALVEARRLAGAVVLVGEAGPQQGIVPERRRVAGVARFGRRSRVSGEFTVFAHGPEVARSSLGVHAIREGRFLVLGADAESCWGRLDTHWVPGALAAFLPEVLARPLLLLPPVGCMRLDDLPGTAQHQLEGRAKGDRRQARHVGRLTRAYRRADARLVVAVAARALSAGREVPLEQVWPRSVVALGRAIRLGALEPACHGLLHLDADALRDGRVEPREFASLSRPDAGHSLDEALAWVRSRLGEPPSFVAPAWGYSEGTLAALRERELPTWLPPAPAPLIEDGHLFRETLRDGLPGLHRLDYRPIKQLARLGIPPTVVLHGRLLDARLSTLRFPRDLWTLARLACRRDIVRLPRLEGVRWVGAGELVTALRAHDRIEVSGGEVRLPEEAEPILLDGAGRRPARDGDGVRLTVSS